MTAQPFHPGRPRYAAAVTFLILFFAGCGLLRSTRPGDPARPPGLPREYSAYALFLAQNSETIEARYTREYEPFEFIVDLDGASTIVQHLIEPAAVSAIAQALVADSAGAPSKIDILLDHVHREYACATAPRYWIPVSDTLAAGRGDCRSLSLMLLSLLLAADIPAYAAVSNGHMWVNAFDGGKWRILETDPDPDRNKIYALPGFYATPLYRIYPDRSEKRKKRPATP